MFDPGIFPALSRAALQPGAQVRILPAGLFRPGDGRPLRAPGWYLDAAIAAWAQGDGALPLAAVLDHAMAAIGSDPT